ncbi:chemotaxis-specific protein-glutamate methyltransferase CheB [Sphingomonas morindae]|uniref:protein-glutamate methylesterase n=1 Tax=Sphingomonas morindae TaxID=1541170 RepID=A0ABY4X8W2_9SPHN|nr:chemotaxis-specific protein-glutamate methyltransferase CheB [Sphingomonas morindae]USI73100.1 chemotaxis-specific protein-glutamate methyltransferase CheB [Sphingomonas morindae]
MATSLRYGRGPERAPTRLLLVDDSIVARSVFQAILGPHPEFEVVGTASTAGQALAALHSTSVDIVLLDLAMPGMDGLTALPEIIRHGRGARVLVVSASAADGADACVRALTLGAADTLEKPRAGFGEGFRQDLLEKLHRIGAEGRGREPAAPIAPVPEALPLASRQPGRVGCIAIGASTGGLHALSDFFRALPASVSVPILITQHLPPVFMPYFAAQMADIAGRPAKVAEEGARLRPGEILVAPGDAHLGVRAIGQRVVVALDHRRAVSGCLPSVDPMFEAVGAVFGAEAFGVVLSGMGRDGSIGARQLVDAGGEIAAQDQRSAVIWGMPGSVARAGLAATIGEPRALAMRLVERLGIRAPVGDPA